MTDTTPPNDPQNQPAAATNATTGNEPSGVSAEAGDRPGEDAPKASGEKTALDAERRARRDAEKRAREATDRLGVIEAAELRRDVAASKGLTDAQAAFLAGTSREEMEQSASDLLAAFKGPSRSPRERLRSGAVPGVEPEDMGQVADRIARNW